MTDSANSPLAVELDGIWKRFPGVVANAGACLRVKPGSVHAVLGENGAGKTTLMNVLAGVYRPDEGHVRLDGVDRMVHQEFRLIPTFTVAENVALGSAPRIISRSAIEKDVAELAERFGLATVPSREVWQLSMGERQRVEILKALWRDARVLILDEPTAVLTPAEAEELGRITSAMAADGRSIIFISHKLDEVTAESLPVATLDGAKLAQLMVGEATEVSQRRSRTQPVGAEKALDVAEMWVTDVHGRNVVDGVALTVHTGEIVGIAGVAGNGQRPLADAIAGLNSSGVGLVEVAGTDVSALPPRARNAAGLAYVPEDRIGVGLAPRMNVVENAMMRAYRDLSNGPFIDREAAEAHATGLVEEYNVGPPWNLLCPVLASVIMVNVIIMFNVIFMVNVINIVNVIITVNVIIIVTS